MFFELLEYEIRTMQIDMASGISPELKGKCFNEGERKICWQSHASK